MVSVEVNTHHICVDCSRQFIDAYNPPKGYPDEVVDMLKHSVRLLLHCLKYRQIPIFS